MDTVDPTTPETGKIEDPADPNLAAQPTAKPEAKQDNTACPTPAAEKSACPEVAEVASEIQTAPNSPADFVRIAAKQLEHNFIFRKLGVAYDYVSLPGDFPRSTLPRGAEIREEKPNVYGIGTGMAECTTSTCLILSGYATRLELGLAGGDEDRVMDRLVAGLIRLGTVAQRGQLIQGLAPDTRSFYVAHAATHFTSYAHGMLRACQTPTLAPASQTKLQDITCRWVARLEKDDLEFPDLSREIPVQAWEREIRLLHILAVTAAVGESEKWKTLYEELAEAETSVCKTPVLPAECTDTNILVSLQLALHDLATLDENEPRSANLKFIRRKIAHRLAPKLTAFRDFAPEEGAAGALLDWRADLTGVAEGASSAEWQEAVYTAWPRLRHEADTITTGMNAALAIMLSGDKDLLEEHTPVMAELITTTPWESIWSIAPLRQLLLLHAYGVEQGLWDEDPVPLPKPDDEKESLAALIKVGAGFGYELEEGVEEIPLNAPAQKGAGRRTPLFPKCVTQLESSSKKSEEKEGDGSASKGNRGKARGGRTRPKRSSRSSEGRSRPPRDGKGPKKEDEAKKSSQSRQPRQKEQGEQSGQGDQGTGTPKPEGSDGTRKRSGGRRNRRGRGRRPKTDEASTPKPADSGPAS